MRILPLALLFILGLAVGDLSGKWNGSFRVDGGDHDVPQLLLLKEDGARLTGTGGPDATERYPISNGQVNGDHVTYDRRLEILLRLEKLRTADERKAGSKERERSSQR